MFPPLTEEVPANGRFYGGGGNRTRATFPPLDVAWAAGLFEGEGTVGYQEQDGRIRMRFALAMTDEDVVRRFHSIMGVGHVNGPSWHKGSTKPQWRWSATKHADAVLVSGLLYPYLGERRRDALERAWHEFATQPAPRRWRADLTSCKRHHPFTSENTRIETTGSRRCRACERETAARKRARNRQAAA